MGTAWEAALARKDERGVVIPAPLQLNNPATAGLPRHDDKHRGPAVTDAYELSRCRIDLAERSEAWPAPANLPPRMIKFAQSIPADQRSDWLRRQANIGEADRRISNAMRSGELPIWVAPIGEPECLVASGAMVDVDHNTVVSGVYRPSNDRGWLCGRPLFVKKADWVLFIDKIQATRSLGQEPATPSNLRRRRVGESRRMSFGDAITDLHKRVKAAVPDADPAPWLDISPELIEMFSGGDEVAYVRRKKMEKRSMLVLQRGLLSGALRAHFSDGVETRDVPGWAWAGAELSEHVWFEGRLPLDVFLPDEWQRWSCHSVYLDSDAFLAWMDNQPFHDLADLPALPPPYDAQARPQPVKMRLPPDAPFVTPSQALTWIAFGFVLDCDSLDRAISGDAFDTIDPEAALSAAMAKLAIWASGGKIAMRGKDLETHATDESKVLTAPIDSVRFEDFAQFDIFYDGLRYGTGLTWEKNNKIVTRISQDRSDGFRAVKVSRAQLLDYFPVPPEPVPAVISIGELSLPEENFDPSAQAEISPWWSVFQTIAWVATRSPAYVERAGQLEEYNDTDLAQFVCFSMVVVYVTRHACTCTAAALDNAIRWETCTCVRDAGRLIIEQIRQDNLRPIQSTNRGSRVMAWHEFAGIGNRPTGADWHELKPAPTFSSAEVIAAFPSRYHDSTEVFREVGRAPSVKAGRSPSDDAILEKASEMKARGLTGRTIAKKMRLEAGFENVATTAVRDLIKGKWASGRPKKPA